MYERLKPATHGDDVQSGQSTHSGSVTPIVPLLTFHCAFSFPTHSTRMMPSLKAIVNPNPFPYLMHRHVVHPCGWQCTAMDRL